MKKIHPIATCEKCFKRYLACRSCGNSVRDMKQEGHPCKCGRSNLVVTEYRQCCQSYNHHLHNTCSHCGQVG